MGPALGGTIDPEDLEPVRLKRLLPEDEWSEFDPVTREVAGHQLRISAEFRPIDLPSARPVAWRTVPAPPRGARPRLT